MNSVSPHPPDRRQDILGKFIEVGLFVASLVVCGAIILMTRPSHDENMYLAAARLLGHGSLYRDFAYLQAPYMPHIYHWVFGITGSEELLTAARLFKVIITGATLVVMYRLCTRLSHDRWFAGACCLLLVGNNVFRDTIPFAKNSDMAVLFVLAGVWVFLVLGSTGKHTAAMVLSGILVGLATGTRLTSVLVPLCLVGGILVGSGLKKRSLMLVLYFFAGAFVALIPAIVISVSSGLDVAEFNNIGYHRLNALWRHNTGYTGPMTLASKLTAARATLLQLPSALIVFLVVWVGAMRIRAHGFGRYSSPGNAFVVMTLPVISFIIYLIPTPAFMSYLSPLVISLVLVACLFYSDVSTEWKRGVRLAAWCLLLIVAARETPDDLKRVVASLDREHWTSTEIHRSGTAIRSAIPLDKLNQPVATLNPLYALEGDLPIYAELATGPFAYRVGGLLTEAQLRRYHTTSPSDIAGLLDALPPSAIVVGFEGDLDSTLVEYASRRNYTRHTGLIDGGTVFVKAPADSDADGE